MAIVQIVRFWGKKSPKKLHADKSSQIKSSMIMTCSSIENSNECGNLNDANGREHRCIAITPGKIITSHFFAESFSTANIQPQFTLNLLCEYAFARRFVSLSISIHIFTSTLSRLVSALSLSLSMCCLPFSSYYALKHM